jgi:hemerythrin-like domain-containing protein
LIQKVDFDLAQRRARRASYTFVRDRDSASYGRAAMTYIVEILRQEHRNIEKVLRVLERELNVFDHGDRPNYEVVLAAIEYFKDYPDSCHHPKEDVIFAKLKARDATATAKIGDLEAEHREEAKRLRRVAQAVESVLNDQDLMRTTVTDVIRDFIEHERRHMAMEERVVFPAALNALRASDWAEIALKLADREDPLSQPELEERFNMLRRKIVELENEAEAARRSAGFSN